MPDPEKNAAVAEPVDLTDDVPKEPDAEPAAFDWSAELPLDEFPEGMRDSLKGKTLKDFAADHTKMRQIASKLGAKNKELEAAIAKAGDKKGIEDLSDDELAALVTEHQDKQIVPQVDYRDVVQTYIETDEVSEDFLDAVETNGARVTREDALDFLQWYKERRLQHIEHITAGAEGVEGQDLWDWMESEECTVSKEILKGFNGQAREDDYSWVPLAAKKFNEFLEAGGKVGARRPQDRFSRGPRRRGRPPAPKPGEGDISAEEFSLQWRSLSAQQAAGKITKADELRAKRVLEKRRRRSTGEQ